MCDDLDLSMKDKVYSFGSDGASTVIGNKNGVVEKVREKVPWLVNHYCVAHILASCSQAAEAIPFMKKFKDTLA